MSTVGWTQSVNANSVVDKIQQVHQMQEELSQLQARTEALKEERLRRSTVTHAPDSEKARLQKEREKAREQKKRERQRNAAHWEDGADSSGEVKIDESPRKIDILV